MRNLRLWPTNSKEQTGIVIGWLVAVFLFVLSINTSFAQDPNNNYCVDPQGAERGGFTLDKIRVCVGTPVRVTGGLPAGLLSVGYVKEYSGKGIPTNFESGPSFQYTKPGSYTILQVGTINNGRALACQTITVLPLDPVKFTAQSCLGRRATLTVDASTLGQYDSYLIRWGDGVSDPKSRAEMQANPAHTYNIGSPNSPTITVEGIYGTVASPLCNSPQTPQQITLLAAATQPIINALTTINDNSIELKYQTSAGVSVELYQKVNGTYVATGQKGTGGGTFTVQTDAKQVQCFQLVPQDACNSQTAKSDEVCSLVLTAQSANKQNNLTWQPYAGTTPRFRFYRLYRNGAPIGPTMTRVSLNSYSDADNIVCGSQYCYSLEATVEGSAQTVITSAKTCAIGINGDPPGEIGSMVISIEDGRPRLITTPPVGIGATDSYTMVVSRASGASGSFQPVATLDRKSAYTDESANPSAGSYCYQVVYQTNCGLQTPPSKTVCTVYLEAKSANGIDWNADSPFAPETVDSYTVEVIDSLNGTRQEINMGANTHYEPDLNDPNLQSQKYRIIALTTGGTTSFSNFYTFRREAKILVPDAFTPNADGMNDEFKAFGIYVDRFLMTIYNRWGEVVYSTTSKSEGWDGNSNGQQAPAGQYMYRIEVIDLTGLKTVRTGAVLLIR
ncbi:gliding motility-associated C-terminal domain-containing protein [Spirosoma sp.]|uniref:gliding motility-associated C-terminal domain-containing protein n=1 Tax=Spirosoma sp. TaxID=1899569 RepID=UPI0026322D38|nr:gliding motility-associated C-terminal domain-containing protein [Spirosoma sp.]MCX6218980.1 gliding motility-associated C-terminal domain-containing protein [Spirosoma sp.]